MKGEKAIQYLYIIISAFVITIVAFPPLVNQIFDKVIREETIKITVLNGEPEMPFKHLLAISGYGYGNMDIFKGNGEELQSVFSNLNSKGFFYQAADPFFTDLLLTEEIGSYIELKGKIVPNFWIALVKHPNAGSVQIEYGEKKNTINLNSKDKNSFERIYIFEGDKAVAFKALIIQLIIYIIIFGVLYSVICILIKIGKQILKIKLIYELYNWKIGVIVCFISLLLGGMLFRKYDSAFLSFGDATWYWTEANCAIVDGKFSLKNYALSESFTARSYLPSFIALGCHILSGWDEMIAQMLYIVFVSAFITLGIAYCMPQLYYMLTAKKANNIQTYLYMFLFCYFFHGLIYNCYTDIYALNFLCIFLFAILKVLKNRSKVMLILAGFCLGGIGLTRNNMLWGVYLFLVALTLTYILMKTKWIKNIQIQSIRFSSIILIFTGMLIICLPEAIINYYRGVMSLFEYDYVGVYNSPTQKLSVELLADALVNQQGWPYTLQNVAGIKMLEKTYPAVSEPTYLDVRHLQLLDIAYIFIQHPVDTILSMLQKFFLYIDVKELNISPSDVIVAKWFGLTKYSLFSLFNHILWSCGFSAVFITKIRKKMFKKQEIWVGIILMLLNFPLLFIHVEWRFFIVLYTLIYYVLSFHLLEFLKDNENKEIRFKFLNSTILITIMLTIISKMLYVGV